MKPNDECVNCNSISTAINEDGTVSQCLECNTFFSNCESCGDKYKTETDGEGSHLCQKCKKLIKENK